MDVLRKAVFEGVNIIILMNLHFILMLIWREKILSFLGQKSNGLYSR